MGGWGVGGGVGCGEVRRVVAVVSVVVVWCVGVVVCENESQRRAANDE